MAKVHHAHYFSKMKVKCQVHSNLFSITNSIIHLEYSFLTLWTLCKGLPAAEKVTYPVQVAQQIRAMGSSHTLQLVTKGSFRAVAGPAFYTSFS